MLANRRLWYCTQITNHLMLHPENVAEFVTVVCDAIDLVSLEAVYSEIKELEKHPNHARNKSIGN